jgi:hypothetical protein
MRKSALFKVFIIIRGNPDQDKSHWMTVFQEYLSTEEIKLFQSFDRG